MESSDSFTAHSCRICLKAPGLISVFEKLDNQVIADSIFRITGVHIEKRSENDRTPRICGSCLQNLQAAKNLRVSVVESDHMFKYKFGVEPKSSESLSPLTIVKVKKVDPSPFWDDPDQDYADNIKRSSQKTSAVPSSDRSKVSRKSLENVEEEEERNKTRKSNDEVSHFTSDRQRKLHDELSHFTSERQRKSHDSQNHQKIPAMREVESDEEWENSNNDSGRSTRRTSEKIQSSGNVERIKRNFDKAKDSQEKSRYADDHPKNPPARVQNEEDQEFNEDWEDHPNNNERRANKIPSDKSQSSRHSSNRPRPKNEDAD